MTIPIGSIKYEWIGDKLAAYVDILADYDYNWTVTLNGTDPNGSAINGNFVTVDNLVNPTPVLIETSKLKYFVPPYTRNTYQVNSLSTLKINLQNGPITLVISNKNLGIPSESNSYLSGNVFDMAQYLLRDGTTPLTGDWDAGAFQIKNIKAPTIAGDAANKGYVDAYVGKYNLAYNGGVMDGATDNGPALNALAIVVGNAGGGTIIIPGKCLIDTNVSLPRGVSLSSGLLIADPGNPFADRTGFYAALQAAPKLIINPAASITLMGSNAIRNMYVTRKGLALDGTDLAVNYTGTAFIGGPTDAITFGEMCVLGFAQGWNFTGTARTLHENGFSDTNAGILHSNANDQNQVVNWRFYNCLQSGVTSTDARTLRSGAAIFYTGTFHGGPVIDRVFTYGHTDGVKADCPGSYKISNSWFDGPVSGVTGRALNAASKGVSMTSASGANVNAELQLSNTIINSQGKGLVTGSDIYGAQLVTGCHFFGNDIDVENSCVNLSIVNTAFRSYYLTSIKNMSKAAGNGLRRTNAIHYDRQVGAIDIDCGTGDPVDVNCNYVNGILNYTNLTPYTVNRDATGLVLIPEGRTRCAIVATGPLPAGAIGDIQPRRPGMVIDVIFLSNGYSFTGGNFAMLSAFAGNANTSTTIRCKDDGSQWVEERRAVY